jgi:hypothetical protein
MPVHYRQRRMCAECPFRRTSLAGWLGDDRPDDVIGLLRTDRPYHCHLDVAKAIAAKRPSSDSAHCAGALQFMKSIAKLPRSATGSAAVKAISVEPDCLTSAADFLAHHAEAITTGGKRSAPEDDEAAECPTCGGDLTEENPAHVCPSCEGSLCAQCDVTHGCPLCGADDHDQDD